MDNPMIEHLYLLRDEAFDTGNKKIVFLPIPHRKGILRHIEKIGIAKRFAKDHQIDIVLSYLLTPHGYLGWILSKILGAKWIHSIIAGHREIWMNGKIRQIINIRMLKSADAVNVMGKATKNYLIENGIREKIIIDIPNAIDGKQFLPPASKSIKYDIIYASRIDENKNFPLLIRAVDRIKTVFPQLKVCVAGDGSKLNEAKGIVHQKGLTSYFEFLGRIDHNQIKSLYYQSKIFVLTSRGEGLPMALLEAMFCGLACISTNVGEIGSIINDGQNGFLLHNADDEELLASRIQWLLTDDSLLETISNNATKIRSAYSYENVAELWTAAINTLYGSQ